MKKIIFIISIERDIIQKNKEINKKIKFLEKNYNSSVIKIISNKLNVVEINKINPDIICFEDSIENYEEKEYLKQFYDSNTKIFEFLNSDNLNLEEIELKADKYIFTNQATLKKYINHVNDFDFLYIDDLPENFMKKNLNYYEDNIKKGFIITFYKTHYNSYEELHVLIKSLLLKNYYIVLASHSYVPFYIQNLCDIFIYEDLNLADQRKYSHGVAEISLIKKALIQLKNLNIEWTYKVSYDVIINDIKIFDDWILEYKYKFVSCLWGECKISTNSFFCNIDFALNNLSFPKTIDEMFSRSFYIEYLWNQDIINKSLVKDIFTFKTKEEMFKTNVMDNNVFNYDELHFTFNEEEKKFYISHVGKQPIVGRLAIIDYYSENIIYCCDCNLHNYTLWVAPKEEFFTNNCPKNGYYLIILNSEGEQLFRRNLNVSDYNNKINLNKIYRSINYDSLKISNDCKYFEFSEFYNFNFYKKFKIDTKKINTFIDAGANLGMFSLELLKNNIKKCYLIEPEPRINRIIKNNLETNFIKIINKALSNKNDLIDFYIFDTDNHSSTNSTINEDNFSIKETIKIESITIDNLFENFIEEKQIDLFKLDIEGAEYDAFESFSDININRCKSFLIEYHNNHDKKILKILERLLENNFRVFLDKYHFDQSENFIENHMGILYAYK